MLKSIAMVLGVITFGAMVTACSAAEVAQVQPTVDVEAIQTKAANDVIAQLTANAPTKTAVPPAAPTAVPPTKTPTSVPSPTPKPPTDTPQPTPTLTVAGLWYQSCNSTTAGMTGAQKSAFFRRPEVSAIKNWDCKVTDAFENPYGGISVSCDAAGGNVEVSFNAFESTDLTKAASSLHIDQRILLSGILWDNARYPNTCDGITMYDGLAFRLLP